MRGQPEHHQLIQEAPDHVRGAASVALMLLGRSRIHIYFVTTRMINAMPRATTPTSSPGAATASHLFKAARGILTANEFFIWRQPDVTHAVFVHLTGIDGVRIRLARSTISVHQETIAFPEHFLFVHTDVEAAGEQTPEARRAAVERWLRSNPRLRAIHPEDFEVDWYM